MNQKLNREFDWTRYPAASEMVAGLVRSCIDTNPMARDLQASMKVETGTRLIDWVDHLCVPESEVTVDELLQCEFESTPLAAEQLWRHPGGMFPVIRTGEFALKRIGIKVESVSQFLFSHRIDAEIDGQPLSPLRMARVASGDAAELWVIERHGKNGFVCEEVSSAMVAAAAEHSESFLRRRRDFPSDQEGFDCAGKLIGFAMEDLGVDWACDLFFAAERQYWQSRNRAAQIQKARQDKLGLGWANHDHHTYRSSRECFASLVAILEMLGFQCRERFYGGAEAGWGAQVLEQPVAGIVIFADVDLSTTEITGDFAHEGLSPRDELGTVGLWCKLHGEAMLQAGMHHLECQFDFDAARRQLAAEGIQTMPPFTDLEFLKQAFTEGEVWPVAQSRIETALSSGWITDEQARRFANSGSIGSHLEILQRDDGYKGFNQTGISEIIRETDPRYATKR